MEKLKTGMPGLDELIDGGLPAGGIYGIVGSSGTGKSIFSIEFLYNGAENYNEPGVCIILEEDKDRMIANMREFGWDLKRLEDASKLRIIPYTKSIVGDVEATFDKGIFFGQGKRMESMRQYLTVDSIYREIEQSCKSIGAKRVVIDPLTSIMLLTDNQITSRIQFLWLVQKLRRLNVTTLAVIEEGIGYGQDILFLCDGIVNLIRREKDGMYERGIVIEKIRGSAHDTSIRPFKITKDGIKVYPREVVIR